MLLLLVVLAAAFPSLHAQIVEGAWCFPENTGPGCAQGAGTLGQFFFGTLSRNGSDGIVREYLWLDFEVFDEIWMGVGFAGSTIGTVGDMIGVHAYIDGEFGLDPATVQEWQLGNHSLYAKHPQQSFSRLIRFHFAPKQRSIRFERLLNSPDRWDSPVHFSGDLCFIWALGSSMQVGAHTPARHGKFCRTYATPSQAPTPEPTYTPTKQNPTPTPTLRPSDGPTKFNSPTTSPTPPTSPPTRSPTTRPTDQPSDHPSRPPGSPTKPPTKTPTFYPSQRPTPFVSQSPTGKNNPPPTIAPTLQPSVGPTKGVVVGDKTTTSAASNLSAQSGLPGWTIPLLVVGIVLLCCMIAAGIYLNLKRKKDLEEQHENRKEARKEGARRLAAAQRREEQTLVDEIKPIDIGSSGDKKRDDEPLLGAYASMLGGAHGPGYYGPPSARDGKASGIAPASRLQARPVQAKKSKFGGFGDDEDF